MPCPWRTRAAPHSATSASRPSSTRGGNYDAPIGALPFAGHTVELTPFCTFKGAWQLSLADQCLRYYSHFDCRAVSAGIRFGRLHLKVTCPPVEGGQWVGVVLTHRYQLESDRAEHYFPLNSLRQRGTTSSSPPASS